MPIKLQQLPGEAIIDATVTEPFDPEQDVPAMFAKFIPMRMALKGPVALIVDFAAMLNVEGAFSQMVVALARAAQGIQASKAAGLAQPPIIIFVGAGQVADIAAQSLTQDQYGGVGAHLCATRDEALAVARAHLPPEDDHPPII